ncbi:peptide-methionine (S)-S-oxide reductase MsrA [Rhodospirillales bacterium]|nr:peptide-methionine (S)-S-oxide reductase MsrA [Rhodospirillales bacterium]
MEKATFGAGCFWGIEAGFRKIEGVNDVAVGYAGGETDNPTYEEVCTGTTGHAEVVEVFFDPSQVTFENLLEVFWKLHDPTTLNRQGPDIGTQYRSAILYHSDNQLELAKISLANQCASGEHLNPIVTEITPHRKFYRAEEYHQRYFEKQGRH